MGDWKSERLEKVRDKNTYGKEKYKNTKGKGKEEARKVDWGGGSGFELKISGCRLYL